MKLDAKTQKEINDWWRYYGDTGYKPDWGKIKLSASNSKEHNMRVCEICITLLEWGVPFATELRLRSGVRPDIVVPTHVKPIIEVLRSETNEDFISTKSHKYPKDLQGCWILHNAKWEYDPKLIC